MTYSDLNNPIFQDADKAREYLETQRWPKAVSCPHCGSVEGITKMQGKSHRPGLFLCGACRGHFSVTVGTVYERSHIPLNKWLLATHLMCSGKKGTSAHQMHRMLGITYKSAWFMCHRIREAMKDTGKEPMGGKDKVVEADETYLGNLPAHKAPIRKNPNRPSTARITSAPSSPSWSAAVRPARSMPRRRTSIRCAEIVRENMCQAKAASTPIPAAVYTKVGREFQAHEAVNHFEKRVCARRRND